MDWYYASNGQQKGPVTQEELAELFRNETVKPFDLVWNESMTEWTPIGTVADFASVAPAAPAASAPPEESAPPLAASSQDAPPALSPSVAASGPGAYGSAPSGGDEPPNYLWQSIVVTVLCCIPLGIPAIVFSTKVKPAYQSGDYAAALDASKKTKMWCLIALVVGFILNLIVIGLNIAAVVGSV